MSLSNRKLNFIVLFCIFLLMWYFNFCTPLIIDDYIYSFVWTGNSIITPLPEDAVRVNGFYDVLYSQWKHYFTWGGRTIAHIFAQTFLWWGKQYFNIFNAGIFVIMLLEIKWIIDKGNITFDFKTKDILGIFCIVWIFSFYLGDIYTWLILSCNYLWTTVLMLLFFLFYERCYLFSEDKAYIFKNTNILNYLLIFLFGIVAGWTNENVPCFVILILGYCFWKGSFENNKKQFMISGVLGMILGYSLLIFAPGNYVRYLTLLQVGEILEGAERFKQNVLTFAIVFYIRIFIFFYIIKNLISFRSLTICEKHRKEIKVSYFFLLISLLSIIVMIASPEFRYRSTFPGLIFMIISAGIIHSVKRSNNLPHEVPQIIQRLLSVIAVAYTMCTLISSIYFYNLHYRQTEIMLSQINYAKKNPVEEVLVVNDSPYPPDDFLTNNLLTGGHLPIVYTLTPDEKQWINVDVALYYGVKAIRLAKED